MGICASTPSRSSCAMRSFFRSTKALHRSSGSSSRAKSSFHVPRTAFVEGTLPDLSVRVADLPRARRRVRARVRLLWQWSLLVAMLLVLVGTVLGLAFAGSPERLPQGTQIAGVDVAGLTPGDARALLERRERERANVPVVFTADGRQWRARPAAVVLDTDWSAAVEAARRQGEGFAPLRGLKRLGVRVFGGEVLPRTRVSEPALDAYVRRFSRALDRQRVERALADRAFEGPCRAPAAHRPSAADRRRPGRSARKAVDSALGPGRTDLRARRMAPVAAEDRPAARAAARR